MTSTPDLSLHSSAFEKWKCSWLEQMVDKVLQVGIIVAVWTTSRRDFADSSFFTGDLRKNSFIRLYRPYVTEVDPCITTNIRNLHRSWNQFISCTERHFIFCNWTRWVQVMLQNNAVLWLYFDPIFDTWLKFIANYCKLQHCTLKCGTNTRMSAERDQLAP